MQTSLAASCAAGAANRPLSLGGCGAAAPPAPDSHFRAQHLTLLTSSCPGPLAGRDFCSSEQRGMDFISLQKPWERELGRVTCRHFYSFSSFLHTPSFSRGCGRCLASHSIRETSPSTGRSMCRQAVRELPSSKGSGATLWSPPLHPWGLKIYLANEKIVSKGLLLNLEGFCGVSSPVICP